MAAITGWLVEFLKLLGPAARSRLVGLHPQRKSPRRANASELRTDGQLRIWSLSKLKCGRIVCEKEKCDEAQAAPKRRANLVHVGVAMIPLGAASRQSLAG